MLWILVIVEDAIGLPIPELAGEPCDTGVIQYGEFWLAGESEVSLGMLNPVSVEMWGEGKKFKTSNAKKLYINQHNLEWQLSFVSLPNSPEANKLDIGHITNKHFSHTTKIKSSYYLLKYTLKNQAQPTSLHRRDLYYLKHVFLDLNWRTKLLTSICKDITHLLHLYFSYSLQIILLIICCWQWWNLPRSFSIHHSWCSRHYPSFSHLVFTSVLRQLQF